MRHLGIDYGTKRIGIALSDEGGTMAFPHAILDNDKNSLNKVKAICEKENVEAIVIGESVDFKGQPNIVKKEIDKFIVALRVLNLPIFEEREFLTTQQARFFQKDRKRVDDSAAALILQSYLDRKNNRPILETVTD